MPSNRKTTTTTETARTIVTVSEEQDPSVDRARDEFRAARAEDEAATLALEAVIAEDWADMAEGLHSDPDVALFLAKGAHEIRLERAHRRATTSASAKERAQRAWGELSTVDVRQLRFFAESVADHLTASLDHNVRQNIGDVIIRPINAVDIGTAGMRRGSVSIVVERPTLSEPMMTQALEVGLGTMSGTLLRKDPYTYVWEGVATHNREASEARKRQEEADRLEALRDQVTVSADMAALTK